MRHVLHGLRLVRRALGWLFEPAWRTRTGKVAVALLTLATCLACFQPGFDALDYYSSLLVAFLGSILAGLAGVTAAQRERHRHGGLSASRALLAAARAGLTLSILPLVLLALNALRVKNCDLLEGAAFYLIGPTLSMLFASQVGALLGLITRKAWTALALFGVVWLGWALRDLHHFYTDPPIFACNPFVGFFSGALYDDVIVIDGRIAWYRLSNLLLLAILWLLARWTLDRSSGRLRLGELGRATWKAWLGLALATASWAAMYGARSELGYEMTRRYIEAELGGQVRNQRVALYYDASSITEAEALRLLEDHSFRLHQLEETFGDRHPDQIASYVYGTPAQKRRLMGASRVFIAKPWLAEIHLNRVSYGAPVIHHELAHAYLGPYAGGLLYVPTAWLVLPHMALVEGAAEAAEWSGGRLTLHQWAAAMRRAELAPELESIMGPEGFWGHAAAKAYTVSGSFIRWLLDERGPESFKRVYRDADFQAAYGDSLAELVRRWGTFVDGLELPPEAVALARDRFDIKGIFHRICPLEIPRLEAEARSLVRQDRLEEALERYQKVVGFVPHDPRKRVPVVELHAKAGRFAEAIRERDAALELTGAGAATRAFLNELVGDALWRAGKLEEASSVFANLADHFQSEGRLRTVLAKLEVVSSPLDREPLLGPYFLGGDAGDAVEYLTGVAADLPGDPLPVYLLGRRLHFARRHREAALVLDKAIRALSDDARPLAVLLVREAWRMLARSLFFSDQLEAAQRAFTRSAELAVRDGDRLEQLDWAARTRWRLGRD